MKKTDWLIALMVLAVGAGIVYWYMDHGTSQVAVSTPTQPAAPPVAVAPKAELPITPEQPVKAEPKYPIEAIAVEKPVNSKPQPPLPPRENSDSAMSESVTALVGPKWFDEFIVPTTMIRNFVVTVDNLPREKSAARLSPLKSIAGTFLVTPPSSDGRRTLDPGNYARYAAFVAAIEALDPKKVVQTYVRYYPLMQQEYRSLGYPDKYFNDRLVEVIDDLLAAPRVERPIKLEQPKVLQQFADPELEALTDNAERVKNKLRAIRRELTAQGPPSASSPLAESAARR
jgi:hypothetical protein